MSLRVCTLNYESMNLQIYFYKFIYKSGQSLQCLTQWHLDKQKNMTNFAVSVHNGRRTLKSVGVKIGNSRLLAFAKCLISNDIKIRFAVPGGSPKDSSSYRKTIAAFFVYITIIALIQLMPKDYQDCFRMELLPFMRQQNLQLFIRSLFKPGHRLYDEVQIQARIDTVIPTGSQQRLYHTNILRRFMIPTEKIVLVKVPISQKTIGSKNETKNETISISKRSIE